MGKCKCLRKSDNSPTVIVRDSEHLRQYFSKVVQGSNSDEQRHGQGSLRHTHGKWRLARMVRSTEELLKRKSPKKLMLVLIEICQNAQSIRVCGVWGCITTDQSGCPCWPQSTVKSANKGCMSIRTELRRKTVAWSDESRFLLHEVDGWLCACDIRMHYGKRQTVRGSVAVLEFFSWKPRVLWRTLPT